MNNLKYEWVFDNRYNTKVLRSVRVKNGNRNNNFGSTLNSVLPIKWMLECGDDCVGPTVDINGRVTVPYNSSATNRVVSSTMFYTNNATTNDVITFDIDFRNIGSNIVNATIFFIFPYYLKCNRNYNIDPINNKLPYSYCAIPGAQAGGEGCRGRPNVAASCPELDIIESLGSNLFQTTLHTAREMISFEFSLDGEQDKYQMVMTDKWSNLSFWFRPDQIRRAIQNQTQNPIYMTLYQNKIILVQGQDDYGPLFTCYTTTFSVKGIEYKILPGAFIDQSFLNGNTIGDCRPNFNVDTTLNGKINITEDIKKTGVVGHASITVGGSNIVFHSKFDPNQQCITDNLAVIPTDPSKAQDSFCQLAVGVHNITFKLVTGEPKCCGCGFTNWTTNEQPPDNVLLHSNYAFMPIKVEDNSVFDIKKFRENYNCLKININETSLKITAHPCPKSTEQCDLSQQLTNEIELRQNIYDNCIKIGGECTGLLKDLNEVKDINKKKTNYERPCYGADGDDPCSVVMYNSKKKPDLPKCIPAIPPSGDEIKSPFDISGPIHKGYIDIATDGSNNVFDGSKPFQLEVTFNYPNESDKECYPPWVTKGGITDNRTSNYCSGNKNCGQVLFKYIQDKYEYTIDVTENLCLQGVTNSEWRYDTRKTLEMFKEYMKTGFHVVVGYNQRYFPPKDLISGNCQLPKPSENILFNVYINPKLTTFNYKDELSNGVRKCISWGGDFRKCDQSPNCKFLKPIKK